MKISVIVPLHNSRRYLSECLESILKQTLKDIEIICVDSSTDGTTNTLHQYKSKDKRIVLIEDRNSSYGYKLNVGIEHARGEYISIVESDDYITSDMLEKLYDAAHRYSVDFVKSNYEGFIDYRNIRWFCPYERVKKQDYHRVIHLKEEKKHMLSVDYNIWTGIYRTDFLRKNGIKFHESKGASYQDVGFANLVAMTAQTTYFLQDYFYKYRMDNEGSSVKADGKYKCIPEEFLWLKGQMEKLGCSNVINDTFWGIRRLYSYYWNYLRLSDEYRERLLKECSGEDIGAFNEKLLDCNMSNKEHIRKLYQGNAESKEKMEQLERKKKDIYKNLIDISHRYPKIGIVCCGDYGQAVYQFLKLIGHTKEFVICDNHIQREMTGFDGAKVLSVVEAVNQNQDGYFIIANKLHSQELKSQMENLGVPEERLYLCDYISFGVGLFEDFNKYCMLK